MHDACESLTGPRCHEASIDTEQNSANSESYFENETFQQTAAVAPVVDVLLASRRLPLKFRFSHLTFVY